MNFAPYVLWQYFQIRSQMRTFVPPVCYATLNKWLHAIVIHLELRSEGSRI